MYIDVIRLTYIDLYVAQEKRIDDYLNVDESRNVSDSWMGFDPSDEVYKDVIKTARRKLKTPEAAAVPRKRAFPFACMRETVVPNTKTKGSEGRSKFSCISEAHESTRQRVESVTKRIHEEHIAGKGPNSVLHYNFVHKSIPMPQAMKIPDAKAAVDKEWKKLETIPAWDVRKVKSKKEVIKEAQKKQQSSLCFIDGLMSSKEFGVGATIPEIQRKGLASRRHCERLPDCDGQAADAISVHTQVK